MDFTLPSHLTELLARIDGFIADEIAPLQAADDNQRFFDHRREHARTDWDNQGLPRHDWEALLAEARGRADRAGLLRYSLSEDLGGGGGGHFDMAVIREHLAAKGLGLHNDLQNEFSIIGNFGVTIVFRDYGSPAQREAFIGPILAGERRVVFALTEPDHGSDATHMETRAVAETRDGVAGFRIDGTKMWTTAMHVATHVMLFARTSGEAGDARELPPSSCRSRRPASTSRNISGRSTCRPTTRWSIIATCGSRPTRSSDRPTTACRSRSISSTTAASARPRRRSARRIIACARASPMPATASRSASRSRATRRSSSRWSYSRRRSRCCAC